MKNNLDKSKQHTHTHTHVNYGNRRCHIIIQQKNQITGTVTAQRLFAATHPTTTPLKLEMEKLIKSCSGLPMERSVSKKAPRSASLSLVV